MPLADHHLPILVRREEPPDAPEVYRVNASAFQQPNEADLVNALRTNAKVFVPELSLVAELDGRIVGHILFTRCWVDGGADRSVESLALAPMAVLPGLQGHGVGECLVRTGTARAHELGFRSVIVLGHAAYYPRFGFVPAEHWGIRPPFDVPSSSFMALELIPDALVGVSGMVRYAPEFGIG